MKTKTQLNLNELFEKVEIKLKKEGIEMCDSLKIFINSLMKLDNEDSDTDEIPQNIVNHIKMMYYDGDA